MTKIDFIRALRARVRPSLKAANRLWELLGSHSALGPVGSVPATLIAHANDVPRVSADGETWEIVFTVPYSIMGAGDIPPEISDLIREWERA